MESVAGLDVGVKQSTLCVVARGARSMGVVIRHRTATSPAAIGAWLRAQGIDRVGLEAGAQSSWLARELEGQGLQVTVMETRRQQAFGAYSKVKDGRAGCPADRRGAGQRPAHQGACPLGLVARRPGPAGSPPPAQAPGPPMPTVRARPSPRCRDRAAARYWPELVGAGTGGWRRARRHPRPGPAGDVEHG